MEKILVADYCVKFRKDPNIWGSCGCYGHPAAVILLSIADSIGSYVIGGSTKNHFQILNHKDYYNLGLDETGLDIIYKKYRNLLTHNSTLALGVAMDIGGENDPVFTEGNDGNHCLNLLPFLELSKRIVVDFLQKADEVIANSSILKEILKK